jgi:hypothetical protein
MKEERKKVLEMLAAGKISADQAEQLLEKLSGSASSAAATEASSASSAQGSARPKYLRVVVEKPGQDQVNVRIPLALAGAGPSLLGVMPVRLADRLAEYGLDARMLSLRMQSLKDCKDFDSLRDINIDVDKGDGRKVRIFCE